MNLALLNDQLKLLQSAIQIVFGSVFAPDVTIRYYSTTSARMLYIYVSSYE